jgi:hypothetical protein
MNDVNSMIEIFEMYGSETWTLTKKDAKILEAVEMWCWHGVGNEWRKLAEERRVSIQLAEDTKVRQKASFLEDRKFFHSF